jgi:hypothetical protein
MLLAHLFQALLDGIGGSSHHRAYRTAFGGVRNYPKPRQGVTQFLMMIGIAL